MRIFLFLVLTYCLVGAPASAQEAPSEAKIEIDPGPIELQPDQDEIVPKANIDELLSLGLDHLNMDTHSGEAWRAWAEGDYVKARAMAARAGALGDGENMLLYGILLDNGLGGPENPGNAVKWYQDAAKNGQIDAELALAGMAFASRGGLSPTDGRKYLLGAAAKKNVPAMISLGKAMISGFGGPLDETRGENWFREAISMGYNPARTLLADLYLTQDKVPEALSLYQTAILGGDAMAAYKAGVLYADPQIGQLDRKKAALYLQTAADAGVIEAMTAYGIMLASSDPKLPAQAARWFRKGALADEPEAQYLFAVSLAKGEGVMQDRELAYEWALRASGHEPTNQEYRALADVLGQNLPAATRELVHGRSTMPLIIIREPLSARLTD